MFSYLKALFLFKCPKCRKGEIFTHSLYDLKNITKMHKNCTVCGQKTELETGFYFGSGYVSYILTVAYSLISFVLWALTIGFSLDDNRLYYWMAIHILSLILLQPWFMRFSRTVWLSWFVK